MLGGVTRSRLKAGASEGCELSGSLRPGAHWLIEPIVELLDDAVIGRAADGVIQSWGSGAEGLYGYVADEVVGRGYEVLVPRERRASDRRVAEGALGDGLSGRYETKRIRKDGAVINVSVQIAPVRDASDEIVGVSTVEHLSGVSAPDRAADVESYMRSAFEDAPIGIALVGLGPEDAGRFLRVNRSLCMLTGCSMAELESHVLWELLHPDDVEPDRIAMARLAAGDSEGFQLEQRVIHRGRQVVWVMVSASLVRDRSGRPLYCIRQVQDIEERKRYEGELGYLVEHDALTGLLSRRGFVRALGQEIAEVRRYGGTTSVLFLDIDDFKNVNDTLGHSVGDEMLSEISRIVFERLRQTDVLARLGGDEFAVLLPRAAEADALSLAHGVLDAVRAAELTSLGGGRRVSVSVGVTTLKDPPAELTADDVLVEADLAMYAAKEGGKDRVAVATVANQDRMRSRMTWAQRVRQALGEDRFQLHCQPIIDLATDTVTQYELLLRLPGEHGELILPAQFLYTAERSGTILEIDRWVLRTAIGLIAEHHQAGHHLRLHVNLSGRSVSEAELPAFIEQHLDDAGIDPANLVLEVTETAAIANMDRARQFATRLTAIGCLFALDDFGAGFGSFYYLKHIPFDYIKIDGEFVQHLAASSTDQLILDSIVRMCKGLGKQTIAEYAGDRETIETLTEHGVDYAQGYHIGRPIPISSALAL